MNAQKIIVIHPGSLNLRIGRASDLNPITILHAIGRRCRIQNEQRSQPSIFSSIDTQPETIQEFEESRLQVVHEIRSLDRGTLKKLSQQIATFNRRSVAQELPLKNEEDNQTQKLKENIFDADILKLNPNNGEYNIYFPMKRGELNLNSNIGGSLTSIITDMETIWTYAIEERMSISRNSLENYAAVLVISDIYIRSVLKELVTLILQRLRFRACFLIQDHVAATFGAGLGYACVVDVGDQKLSISCVEDGISHPDTRVRLGYGSGELTQVFFTLLKKNSFPYKECNVETVYADATLIKNLKEHCCHLNLDMCGAQERIFEVKKPTKILRYTFQLGDESVVAPLAFFHTELFNICGKQKLVRLQLGGSQQCDPEDCFDAEYIRETGRVRNGRGDQLMEGVMPVTGDTEDDLVVVDNFEVEDRSANIRNSDKDEQLVYFSASGQIVPIDVAIVQSIERCPTDDMKRKMYGCVLLVGGGSKINGFAKLLEQKITLHLANTRSADHVAYEVNVCVKEMDASMIAWKGAAIMSCLESAPELWLLAEEWKKYGLRILREKATFIW